LNYTPTTLGVQSLREIIFGGTRAIKVEYHWSKRSPRAVVLKLFESADPLATYCTFKHPSPSLAVDPVAELKGPLSSTSAYGLKTESIK
jgi:hypothetical protein